MTNMCLGIILTYILIHFVATGAVLLNNLVGQRIEIRVFSSTRPWTRCIYIKNERLCSRETLVPRPWESETIKLDIKHFDMVQHEEI